MADDSDYFTRRAIEEGKFAAAASSIAARARDYGAITVTVY
jgi:hypothetical protein